MDEVKLKNFPIQAAEEKKNNSRPNINRFHSNTIFFFSGEFEKRAQNRYVLVFFSSLFDTNVHAHTNTAAGVYVSVGE